MPDDTRTEPSVYIDDDGRRFEYVHVTHPGSRGLGIHFSAFFGKWGDAKPYRDTFQGYFHRMKMLGSCTDHDWLFLCDSYGAFRNGTYYTGEHGDSFVERAMLHIIDEVMSAGGHRPKEVVTIGSSMGATGAIKFGMMRDVGGIVAICPHIDLDISAAMQEREEEVAFITADGAWDAVENHPITRQLRSLLDGWPGSSPLPVLFIQSCADDVGVHEEQVVPFAESWRQRGGQVVLDVRPVGGHTSDYATRPLLLDAVGSLMRGEVPNVDAYRTDERFAATLTVPPLYNRLRHRLHVVKVKLARRH